MYTVKQLADLAGVSVRTLHHYDQIGLLNPSEVGANSYRYYNDEALLRLQQILFYREIGLELAEIKTILDSPDFDLVAALRSHRKVLAAKIERLQNLVNTVDSTILHVAGEVEMSKKQLFRAFSPEEEKENERLARLQYGPELVNESVRRWNSYSEAEQENVRQEGNQIYNDLANAVRAEIPPESEAVQDILRRWHQHLRYFYEPTLDLLRGLGDLYYSSPDFIANFEKLDPDLPDYLHEAIDQYVDDLETAEIERMLAEDEARKGGE